MNDPQAFTIIIPARFGSSRLPGKPLAPLRGATGLAKPLIQRTWECAMQVPGAAGVWVATDDARIAARVRGFGGQVVETPETCRNGTERCAAAAAALCLETGIVVNLQGDAPLTAPDIVAGTVAALRADPGAAMAAPGLACPVESYREIARKISEGAPGVATVVASASGRALYFSRRLLPYLAPDATVSPARIHLGLYAYRVADLAAYARLAPTPLEACESLEQLRFLEADLPVKVVPFAARPWDSVELNHPEDIAAIEAILAQRGIA